MIITVGSLEHIVLGFIPGFEIFGFLGGNAQAIFLLILDIVQALVIIALGMGVLNRTVIPSGKRREVNSIDAVVILGMIFGLMVSDFGYRASKVALGVQPETWLPISSLWAELFLSNVNASSAAFSAEFFWWFHIALILAFLNYLPYSKHSHVLTVVPNVFFQNLEPRGKMNKIDFENLPDDVEQYANACKLVCRGKNPDKALQLEHPLGPAQTSQSEHYVRTIVLINNLNFNPLYFPWFHPLLSWR